MSRRKGKNQRSACGTSHFYGDTYWQSANYNRKLFNALRNQVINMALMRFKWLNLPSTCDERFLEWSLFFNGVATIARPMKLKNTKQFYSTQALLNGRQNVYLEPVKWESFGINGWKFRASAKNGVLIYDNMSRVPTIDIIDLYVRELVDVMRTKQINRMHTKSPFIVKTPQDKELDAINMIKQVIGGEPAILGTNALSDINFEVLNTEVRYLGQELTADELNIWNRIYSALGISNLTFKAERQIEDEVEAFAEPTDLMALSPLQSRRWAVEKLNDRFGLDIKVVWRKDNQSENYNSTSNIKDLTDILSGETHGLLDVINNDSAV